MKETIRYKHLLSLFLLVLQIQIAISAEPLENYERQQYNPRSLSDGPYIFYDNDKVNVKWVLHNRPLKRTIRKGKVKFIERYFDLNIKYDWILHEKEIEPNYKQEYKNIDKLIAISDVHGQYDLFVELLKEYGVIDDSLNWNFGTGHLVVLGDIMDRGDKVTESLWLVFKLEKQAEIVGGKVHFILGNHELMVLNNDARYINSKYLSVSTIMKTTYNNLFSENSVLGTWLRKKPIMVNINNILFVHAGISIDYMKQNSNIEESNKVFVNKIIGKTWDSILLDSSLTLMTGNKGPLWYRGYFTDIYLKEYQIDHILDYYKVDHIIVGHTSLPNITTLFNKKIIGIDSNIKLGKTGEILMYEDNQFYRCKLDGSKNLL